MLEQQQIQQQWQQRQRLQQQQQQQRAAAAGDGADGGDGGGGAGGERANGRRAGRDEDRAPDDVLMGTGVDLKEEEALLGGGGGGGGGSEVGAGGFYGRGGGASRFAAAGTLAPRGTLEGSGASPSFLNLVAVQEAASAAARAAGLRAGASAVLPKYPLIFDSSTTSEREKRGLPRSTSK